MKAFFKGIEVEGTLEEIRAIIQTFSSDTELNIKSPISVNKNIYPKQKAINKNLPRSVEAQPEIFNENFYVFPEVTEFVKALYRYRPDRFSPLGRAPYVVTLLASGESYTMKRLIQLSNSNSSTVSSAIKRAADAGCVIEVTGTSKNFSRNTKVKMVSLGTPEQATQVREALAPSKDPRTAQYKMRYKAKAQNDVNNVVNRNSPPVVKIVNNN
ncbi:MAG: hypothetical protein O3A39_04790 [Proteobacteria bacterium]|nr:hypothetical protein [Pseudomonadota bacterium]